GAGDGRAGRRRLRGGRRRPLGPPGHLLAAARTRPRAAAALARRRPRADRRRGRTAAAAAGRADRGLGRSAAAVGGGLFRPTPVAWRPRRAARAAQLRATRARAERRLRRAERGLAAGAPAAVPGGRPVAEWVELLREVQRATARDAGGRAAPAVAAGDAPFAAAFARGTPVTW